MKDLYKCLSCGNLETTDKAPISCGRCGSELIQRIPEGVSTSTRVEVLNGAYLPTRQKGVVQLHLTVPATSQQKMRAQFDTDVDD